MRTLFLLLVCVGVAVAGCATKTNNGTPTTTTPGGSGGTNNTGTGSQLVTDNHDFTTDATAGTPAGGATSKAFTIPSSVTMLNLTVKWTPTAPVGTIDSGVTVKVGNLTCTLAAGPVQAPIPSCTKTGPGTPGSAKIEYSGAGPVTANVVVSGS